MEVAAASQPAEKEAAENDSLGPTQRESVADTTSTSCINQENGESLTRTECPAAFDVKRQEQTHAVVDDLAIGRFVYDCYWTNPLSYRKTTWSQGCAIGLAEFLVFCST